MAKPYVRCSQTENSVSYVYRRLFDFRNSRPGEGFPAQFDDVLIEDFPEVFLPSGTSPRSTVRAATGTGSTHASGTAHPSGHSSTTEHSSKSATQSPAKVLASCCRSESKLSEGTTASVPGLVRLASTTTCDEPNLGSDSFVHGYIFDNASDYQASLTTYNNFKGLLPFTPGVGCPTTNDTDNGTVGWKDKAFPARSDQVLECTTVAAADSNSSPKQRAGLRLDGALGVRHPRGRG